MLSSVDILGFCKRNDKNRIVVKEVESGRVWAENRFNATVNSLADYLSSFDETEIVVRENNSLELLVLYFAAMFAGKVIIPIDPEKEESEVRDILNLHSTSAYFEIGKIKLIVSDLDARNANEVLEWEKVDFDREYLITYTSGSTGVPKGVKHNLYNLFSTAIEFGTLMKYNSSTVMGHCMPMTYMAGILNTIIKPYIMGGTIVVLPRFSMQMAFKFWKYVESEGINTLWLSPTMLRIANMIDKRGEMREYFSSSKMKISVGTAPLDASLRNDFEKKYGVRLYQSYGLSETLFISTEVLEEIESKNTVGHLLPSVKLHYAPDGEIQIEVPWMFLGYTNVDTGEYMSGNRYLSGDLGDVIDGNLIISGRKKELIVKGGYNINPRDIEKCIIDNGFASECAVVPVKIKGEEMIVACAVESFPLTNAIVNDKITAVLGKHYRVDFLETMKTLPKNLNGKIDKPTIKKQMDVKYGIKD